MFTIKSNNDIWITRGDDAIMDLEIRQNNFPYDIYKIKEEDKVVLTVRKSSFKADKNEQNPILFQISLIDNSFFIESNHTKDLEFGNYSYDVQIILSNKLTETIIGPNIFRILPEVTY
jgi:hypothetical protein